MKVTTPRRWHYRVTSNWSLLARDRCRHCNGHGLRHQWLRGWWYPWETCLRSTEVNRCEYRQGWSNYESSEAKFLRLYGLVLSHKIHHTSCILIVFYVPCKYDMVPLNLDSFISRTHRPSTMTKSNSKKSVKISYIHFDPRLSKTIYVY